MRYKISARSPSGPISASRDSPATAVDKALEYITFGMRDVRITDVETGRIYRSDEFELLLKAD